MNTEILLKKIDESFIRHGFIKEIVNGRTNYVRNGKYRKVTYVEGLQGFVIEYADSLHEAQKNLYEDGDVYPLSLKSSLIGLLEKDIIKFML